MVVAVGGFAISQWLQQQTLRRQNLLSKPTAVLIFQIGAMGVADIGVGWTGWGIFWADIDSDSDLDLMVVNGNVPVTDPPNDTMLVQAFGNLTAQGQAGQFQELTQGAGLETVGPFIWRGGAMADYDNDGDLDLALYTIGGQLALL